MASGHIDIFYNFYYFLDLYSFSLLYVTFSTSSTTTLTNASLILYTSYNM